MTVEIGGDPTKEMIGLGDASVVPPSLSRIRIRTADSQQHEFDCGPEALQLLLNLAIAVSEHFPDTNPSQPGDFVEMRFVRPTEISFGRNVDPGFITLVFHFGTARLGVELATDAIQQLATEAKKLVQTQPLGSSEQH